MYVSSRFDDTLHVDENRCFIHVQAIWSHSELIQPQREPK